MKEESLHRGLKNRHVQLIALGGAVGTGLFLGSAATIQMAGPAVIFSYAIGGIIAFLIMRQLGEMITEEPIAGSFSNLAHKYWGDFPGMLSGFNYWMLYILVGMSELTAVSRYVQYWWPDMQNWQIIAIFFIVINCINLFSVRLFGEMEFWFALIKVLAIIGMIALGSYLLASGKGGPTASVSNLWLGGSMFPMGAWGFLCSLPIVMFSFGGLELVGIAAAETADPQKTIPRAINQVLYRILIFYIGALVILLALNPWNQLGIAAGTPWNEAMVASPFVKIFSNLEIHSAAHILNFIVLTAALSVYNSCVYCNSRMLYGLSLQGNAPKFFRKVDTRGVPVYAVGISGLATLICIVLNYVMPDDALGILLALVVASLVINWAMISITHIFFRQAAQNRGKRSIFPSILYPFANYVCLLFITFMLVMLYLIGMTVSVGLIPVWIGLIYVGYYFKKKKMHRTTKQ